MACDDGEIVKIMNVLTFPRTIMKNLFEIKP